ncbi:hypothetical protein ACXR0O_26195 [Verrucomicrobiota bacterium sgz303538]
MIRGLLEKELRQHATTFAFLVVVLLVGLASITGNRFLSQIEGTGLGGVRLLLLTVVPLASVMLGHVLIAGEYSRKTQLFLEGLPLPRWRMLAVKYMLGLTVLVVSVGATLLVGLRKENEMDALTSVFASILIAKTFGWAFFVYSLFFTHALLGRYRIPSVALLCFALLHLHELGVPLGKFAAFQLIDQRFAYEAHHFPQPELLVTLLTSLVLVGFSFWLGLARDSGLVTMLAQRMSGREKVLFSFITLGVLMSVAYAHERREQTEAVRMPGVVELERGLIYVAASAAVNAPTSTEEAAVKRIVPRAVQELEDLAKYLGCSTMPRVFIVHRRDFPVGRFENGGLKQQQGLMLRANLAGESFSEDGFLERLVQEVLLLKSAGRAGMEPNAWVLDGFPSWWTRRQRRQREQNQKIPDVVEPSRALAQRTITEQDLRHWFTFRKTVKEENATICAREAIELLRMHYGEQVCRAFLGAMLARDLSGDVRGWLSDSFNPMPRRFERATGAPLKQFVGILRTRTASATSPTPSAE